ncbi:MAG: hypothetical protein ABW047_07350 [Nitrospiraceae bacterium]
MANIIAFPLLVLLLASGTVYAQGHCLECYKAADEEVARCLADAISEEDKIACLDNQQDQSKVCDHECKAERELMDNPKEVSPKNE